MPTWGTSCIEVVPQVAPLDDCWYASPQLFFTCYLHPKNGRLPKNQTYRTGPDDIFHHLVFFSTFEELKLPISGPMDRAGVTKLYEPSPTPHHAFMWLLQPTWWAEFP